MKISTLLLCATLVAVTSVSTEARTMKIKEAAPDNTMLRGSEQGQHSFFVKEYKAKKSSALRS